MLTPLRYAIDVVFAPRQLIIAFDLRCCCFTPYGAAAFMLLPLLICHAIAACHLPFAAVVYCRFMILWRCLLTFTPIFHKILFIDAR